jgi:hypothetical protein
MDKQREKPGEKNAINLNLTLLDLQCLLGFPLQVRILPAARAVTQPSPVEVLSTRGAIRTLTNSSQQ